MTEVQMLLLAVKYLVVLVTGTLTLFYFIYKMIIG